MNSDAIAIDSTVDNDGLDIPDDELPGDSPSPDEITSALENSSLPVCPTCVIPVCGQLNLTGPSSAIDVTSLQQAIVNAYIYANQWDATTSASSNASIVDSSDG